MSKASLFIVAILFFGISCSNNIEENDPPENNPSSTPNILLIIADDMGKDATNGLTEGMIKPTTPNIDNIKNNGLTFNNFWVYPTCSPTRASMITGKYGYRTDVKWAGDELDAGQNILHNYIKQETNNAYSTAIVGKWHLSNIGNFNPESFGMDYYSGLLRGAVPNYYNWQLTEDGNSSLQTKYVTEVFTDKAIDWVGDQTKPWFLWLAYNAPHTPFHVPPSEMHTQGALPAYEEGLEPLPYFLAAIEALDYQIGRLLDSMTQEERDNTIIIFMGDNGTPNQVAQSPYSDNTAKGSLYQGGINVPLFITGPGVSRNGEDDHIISSTDMYSTIAELAGASTKSIYDSKSFKSLLSEDVFHREFQYSEKNNDNEDSWTISDGTYKLIVNADGMEEMYDLLEDPYEMTDLLNSSLSSGAINAKASLEQELINIRN